MESVCYTVFISFEFPFSYKLNICFIYYFIFCIVALEYPFTIIYRINILFSCWLTRSYICFICITILVCWFIAFYCCWQRLTWRSTFESVCYTVFISFEYPCSNKLYICFVYLFFSPIISFEDPFSIILSICILCRCWLTRSYICFICITVLICWFIAFYRLRQCLIWSSALESVCYTVFISFEFPFSYKLNICFIYYFIFCIVALEYPFTIIYRINILFSCWLTRSYICFICITILVCWFIAFYCCWQYLIWRSTYEFIRYIIKCNIT